MSDNAKPLFIVGSFLLFVAIASLGAMTVLLVRAGGNVEPGEPGLLPGQSHVFLPVGILIGVAIAGLLGGIFSLMIASKRLSRNARNTTTSDDRIAA